MTDNNQQVNEQADDFPPLPRPAVTYADHSYPAFSKLQMQAYARAAIEQRAALAHPIGQQAGESGEGADGIAADRLARANSSNFSSGCNVGVEHDHSEGGHHD